MRLRLAGLALAASVALFTVACGSGGGSTAAPAGASLAPGSTAVLLTINTDSTGGQWQAAQALLAKFPGGADLIEKAFQELESEDIDFDGDIRPAFGPETDVVVLSTESGSPIVLTQPADVAKLQELAASGDEPAVTAELEDGWWAVAPTQASLDAYTKAMDAGDPLAESDDYTDAIGNLPETTLATVYVNTAAVSEAPPAETGVEIPFDEQALAKCFSGGEDTASGVALAVIAEDDGLRFSGGAASGGVMQLDGEANDLDELFPSGAVAYVSVSGLGKGLRSALDCVAEASPETGQSLAQAQLLLGASLEDLTKLFDGETAVGVYLEGTTPQVYVALEPDDADEARQMIERMVTQIGLFAGDSISTQDAGNGVTELHFGDEDPFYLSVQDGKLVFSNVNADLAGASSHLADDPDYQAALEAAGASDDAAALGYVNIAKLVELASAESDPPPSADDLANLAPLKSLVFWAGEPDDGSIGFEGFLQIQ